MLRNTKVHMHFSEVLWICCAVGCGRKGGQFANVGFHLLKVNGIRWRIILFTLRNNFFLASMKTGYIIYFRKTKLIKEAYVFCLAAICNPRPPRCALTFKGENSLLMIIIYKYFINLISSDCLQFVFHCAVFSEIQTNYMLMKTCLALYYFMLLNWIEHKLANTPELTLFLKYLFYRE